MDKKILINNAIMQDMSLSYAQKMALVGHINSLSDNQLNSFPITQILLGGSIGAIVAKFLLGLGLKSSIILSLAGSALGYLSSINNTLTNWNFTDYLNRNI